MTRRRGRLRRLHARAAFHIYQRFQKDKRVPWLGVLVALAGFGIGILVDLVMSGQGWAPADSTRGAIVGGVLGAGWVIFALFGGGGYGPEDR